MNLRCPGCSGVLKVPDTAAGQQFKCPKCAQVFACPAVPAAPVAQSPPQPAPPQPPPVMPVEPPAPAPAEGDRPQSGLAVDTVLGGCEIIKELGRGGMGRVYLARQKSLDRLIALKIMDPARVRRPMAVARFRREAFAAAQITHHNVVQIYDIGFEKDLHFFTMEYVRGQSLMALVEREGPLDPDVAAGYILQAARGLKFGHDMGMVHRDVKPDNLLLNDQGIIKVADMGLVKLAAVDTHMTRIGGSMGTPNYIAPEQARNAVDVDGRADIYSLGCTLYVLLTAQLPFEGKTVTQVRSKLTGVAKTASSAPTTLSAILNKMVARDRDERYPNMDAVIAALEKYLGGQQGGGFGSRDEQTALVKECVHSFNHAPHVRVRQSIVWGLAGLLVLAGLFLLLGQVRTAAGLIGLAFFAPLTFHVIHGFREGTHLFRKIREGLAELNWIERAVGIGAVLFGVLLLHLLNLVGLWSAMLLLAIVLAALFYLFVDRPLALERKPVIDRMENLLRGLRRQGWEERAVRRFVCKHCGRDWEEFFEELFGYDAKIKARRWLHADAERRKRFAAWRDPLLHWLDERQKAGKDARARVLLESAEVEALQEQGVDKGEARKKATRLVTVMVAQAAQVPKQESPATPARPETFKILRDADQPYDVLEEVEDIPGQPWTERLSRWAGLLLGGEARVITGALLFAGFVLWLYQNDFVDGHKVLRDLQNAAAAGNFNKLDRLGRPLALPPLPSAVGTLFNNFNPAIAGVLLVASASWFGWRSCLLSWAAAIIILLSPQFTIDVRPLTPGLAGLLGGLTVALLAKGLRD